MVREKTLPGRHAIAIASTDVIGGVGNDKKVSDVV